MRANVAVYEQKLGFARAAAVTLYGPQQRQAGHLRHLMFLKISDWEMFASTLERADGEPRVYVNRIRKNDWKIRVGPVYVAISRLRGKHDDSGRHTPPDGDRR